MERREMLNEISERIFRIISDKVNDKEPPEKIWLTDTVYCGRKKIFSMMGIMKRFSGRILNRIWLGIIIGEALKELGVAGEVSVEYRGIRGKVDIMLESGEPVEVKTTSSFYIPSSEYAKTHVEQLSRYCLALNKKTGILLYYIPNIDIATLPIYRYEFDLDEIKSVTDERIDILEKAAKIKDPFILPTTWHSKDFNNWECKDCQYISYCRMGAWERI